jgi:hypothetical protein
LLPGELPVGVLLGDGLLTGPAAGVTSASTQ